MKTPRTQRPASLAVAILVAAGVAGCGNGQVELETRTFELEHLSANAAQRIVEPYVYGDREGAPGAMSRAEGLLSVRETEDNLDRIERVLEQYDRPRGPEGGLTLRFQLVEADGFDGTDAEIADVEEELRGLFRFEGYRLAASGVLTVDGRYGSFTQSLSGTAEDRYSVGGNVGEAPGGGDRRVFLQEITLVSDDYGSLFQTTVTIRPGQTLVLGSAGVPDREGAVILIVRASSAEGDGPA